MLCLICCMAFPLSAESSMVLLDWIFQGVLDHLGRDRLAQIDVQGVAQVQHMASDVGQFIRDLLLPGRILANLAGRFAFEPKEMLHQLRRFHGQAHDQVLGAVEWLPGPVGGKTSHGLTKLGHGRVGVGHSLSLFLVTTARLPPFAQSRRTAFQEKALLLMYLSSRPMNLTDK